MACEKVKLLRESVGAQFDLIEGLVSGISYGKSFLSRLVILLELFSPRAIFIK